MIKNIYKLDLRVKLLSGLHIGGSSENFDIGGSDSNVIRNPITYIPYIPGSSLKGKLRSLLEYQYGEIVENDSKLDIVTKNEIINLFEPIDSKDINITRAIFRDLTITEESIKKLEENLGLNTYTEIKAENKINRINGKADNPRFIERIPSGIEFEGEIVLMTFEGDDEEFLKGKLVEALELLELNYLGGSGSRGYGRVQVINKDFKKVEI